MFITTKGEYYGLNYKYNLISNTLDFTDGKLTWDSEGSSFLDKFAYKDKVKHINFSKEVGLSFIPRNFQRMFMRCDSLESVNMSGLDIKQVHNIDQMFFRDTNLQSVNLSGLNTSNVEDTTQMFCADTNLKEIDLRDFDTSNVLYMDGMFELCNNLEHIKGLSDFNTTRVEEMNDMFSGDYHLNPNALKKVIKGWKLNKKTDTSGMLDGVGKYYQKK